MLAAGLAKGLSRVYNLDPSQDIAATLAAVRAFGAKVKLTETYADIEGRGGFATILRPVDCGESGSTLRFLVPVLSLTGQQVEFTGRGRLFQRPMDVYRDIFAAQGLLFSQSDKGLVIRGRLAPGEYRVRGMCPASSSPAFCTPCPCSTKKAAWRSCLPSRAAAMCS